MFSFGSGNVAEYQSNVLEWPGEADRFKFPESKSWHGGIEVDPKDQYLNPKSLADAGHNPPKVIVEECRKRGLDAFVSLRMNDIHDGQHARGTLPNPELPTFKRINPDWLVDDLDWWTALNFAHPRVRALKLKVAEEFFDRWDFDGIELDWLRHTLYFQRGTERENGKYLTEFMRSIRKSLNEKAKRRGRPIEIAIRIPEKLEWCALGGFEIEKWIEEDLADMLILGQGLTELPTMDEFRGLMKARQLPIYPSLYSYGNSYRVSPDEVIRGSAANLWRGRRRRPLHLQLVHVWELAEAPAERDRRSQAHEEEGQALHGRSAVRGQPPGPGRRLCALQHGFQGRSGPLQLERGRRRQVA